MKFLQVSAAVFALLYSSTVDCVDILKKSQLEDPVARSSAEAHQLKEVETKVAKSQHIKMSQADHGDSSDEEKEKKKKGGHKKSEKDESDDEHEKKKGGKKPPPKPVVKEMDTSKDLPTIAFSNDYGNHGHNDDGGLQNDIPLVKVTAIKPGTGNWAKLDDWTVVHWKTWSNGQQVEDSRQMNQGKPHIFKLGHYQVSKCWDIAIQQMKPKGTYKVFCPGSLNDKEQKYAMTGTHQYGGDVTYEIEVIESDKKPIALKPEREVEDMVEGQCFYIVHKDKKKNEYALEVSSVDAYAPRVTGVYNVALYPFKGRKNPNKAQQWVYHTEDKTVSSMFLKDGALFEGFNQNVIVYKNYHLNNQRFDWHSVLRQWTNSFTGRALDIVGEDVKAGSNIVTRDVKFGSYGQKFDLVYCEEDHGHDHHH